jgi:predicted RNA-binding protein Jag
MYETNTKGAALEYRVIEKSFEDIGITASEDEIAEEIENPTYMSLGVDSSSLNAGMQYLNAESNILTKKGLEYFKEHVEVTDDEIDAVLEKPNKYSKVKGEYKTVTEVDAKTIKSEGILFSEIENHVSLLDQGESDILAVKDPASAKVGEVVEANGSGNNIMFVYVQDVYNTDDDREYVKRDLTNDKAEDALDEFVSDALSKLYSTATSTSSESGSDVNENTDSTDSATVSE